MLPNALFPTDHTLDLSGEMRAAGVSMPPGLWAAAQADAYARGLSLSALIRTLLIAHLAHQDPVLPEAGKAPPITAAAA
jgi:hypothetical protein